MVSMARPTLPRSPGASMERGAWGVGADAGQGVGLVEDADRLGGDEEEPAAAHAHHPVPHQPDGAVGDVQFPKPPATVTGREQPHRFVEVAGLGDAAR